MREEKSRKGLKRSKGPHFLHWPDNKHSSIRQELFSFKRKPEASDSKRDRWTEWRMAERKTPTKLKI
jgi:hypothetical protein